MLTFRFFRFTCVSRGRGKLFHPGNRVLVALVDGFLTIDVIRRTDALASKQTDHGLYFRLLYRTLENQIFRQLR